MMVADCSYLQVFFQSAPGGGFLLKQTARLADLLLQLSLLSTFLARFLLQLLQSFNVGSVEHQLPLVLGLSLCSQLGLTVGATRTKSGKYY